MKDLSCYIIFAYGEKKLSILKDDVVYIYLVRDKFSFAWMSYGLCFLEGWMLNHPWGDHEIINPWRCYEGDLEEIWIKIWM